MMPTREDEAFQRGYEQASRFGESMMAVWQNRAKEAQDEARRLREALIQFVAACDTAPPTSLMTEIGMACEAAKAALFSQSRGDAAE